MNSVEYLLYMELLNYLFCDMFGGILECYELTHVLPYPDTTRQSCMSGQALLPHLGGCEVSCGGHHRPRGKTTTGSALDGAVFDIAQILAYLIHNMSRSQLYLGFGHFG